MLNVEELKNTLKNANLTYEEFSKICNVPVDTLKNILSGRTKNPRGLTEKAIVESIKTLTPKIQPPIISNYISNEEEEILDMYRKLSKENKSVILKNFYILLNPDERSDYQILKYIE